uniref:NADH dehydrogenase subunit 5 n=1 Tax=Hypnea marchantiae TaxID=3024792 RepID=UPI003002CA6C|nr:NADH dehydrogenase subunit 5 [Hypnea marchantiae]
MYLCIVLLPLLGALFSGLLGRWIGSKGSCILTTFCVLLSGVFSGIAFFEVGLSGTIIHLILESWIESGLLIIKWGFLFDTVTATMLIVITWVSTLVHIYSISYMETDPHRPRFMCYLCVFTFFMLMLVTADNLLQMFLGWEGVGLASYLLINFWYTRLGANQSAIKALVVNRIGDFGLSLGIFSVFCIFKSLDYSIIFSTVPFFDNYCFKFLGFNCDGISLIGFFLFIGAMGKSAQLGLHTWLPDAMEGPTPVSALIHAATMVTAGVFLMIRFSPLLEFSTFLLSVLVIFGSLTAFFAGMTGIFQNDLKKVIAYSTCSQLGYMVFSCGMSCYEVSLFHLTNHAFFKALLFLSAGSVIHAVNNEQDMRRMGSLVNFLPMTYSLMLIGSLALTGFPFLTGFYSKDFILELTHSTSFCNLDLLYSSLALWLGSISVLFTSFYSFRLIYLTFLNSNNSNRIILSNIHESPWLMSLPLILLAIGSLFFGFIAYDLFIGLGTDFWKGAIFVLPNHNFYIEAENLPIFIKWLPFLVSTLGILLASLVNITYIYKFFLLKWYKISFFWVYLINKKWFFDTLYNRLFVYPILNFGYLTSFKALDRGFIELAGPFGLSNLISKWSSLIFRIQTGQMTHYIFYIIVSVCIFSIIYIYKHILLVKTLHLLIFYFFLVFFI